MRKRVAIVACSNALAPESREKIEKLKADNPDNLFYVTAEGLSGNDNEGTVDGIHFTDLGFRAYADKLNKVLKKIVK